MPTFHRKNTQPAGYDTLPGGYDYINNPSLNSQPGVPAVADGMKTGGPNAGTYFKAFGEDSTSKNDNRAADALADNCDTLDNYLRKPTAIPTRTNTTVAGFGGDSSIVLPTSPAVYLGTSGQDTIQEIFSTLFTIVDTLDNPITDLSSGDTIEVNGFSSTDGGDGLGGGFAAGTITINFNHPIPNGTQYRIYYGGKGNLATLPPDAFLRAVQRNADQGWLSDFVRQISVSGELGNDVDALVASNIRTPDGVRLNGSNVLSLDVDPGDVLGSTTRSFLFRSRQDTGSARTLVSMIDDPSASLGTGTTGRLQLAPLLALVFGGLGLLQDANILAGAAGNMLGLLPLSSAVSANGDKVVRLFDKPQSSATPNTYPESILQAINSRFSVTVGDGTNTFGDFNGAGALDAAVAYFIASGAVSGRIQVKAGTYTWTHAYTLGAAKHLAIEGVSSRVVQVNVNVASGVALTSTSPVLVKGIFWNYTGGSFNWMIIDGQFGAYGYFYDVRLDNLSLTSLNASASPSGQCLFADRCTFNNNTSGLSSVDVSISTTGSRSGFVFTDCSFTAISTDSQIFRIVAGNTLTVASIVGGFKFIRTNFICSASLVTSGQHAHNTGVLEIVPGSGTTRSLTITDIGYYNCNVFAGSGGGAGYASILAYIMPIARAATAGANEVVLQKVSIIGGTWDAGSSSSDLAPLFICAQKVVVRDVDFLGTSAPSAGAPPKEAQFALYNNASPTLLTADWATFTFSVGFDASIASGAFYQTDLGITLEDCNFSRLQQLGCGDLRVDLPAEDPNFLSHFASRIQRLTFSNYIASSVAGTPPNYRFNIVSTNTVIAQTGSNLVNCVVDQVVLRGKPGGVLTGGWTTSTAGIVGIDPMNGLTCRAISIAHFSPGSGVKDTGFFIKYDIGSKVYGISMINCSARDCQWGLLVQTPGGTPAALDGFEIVGGSYSNNVTGIQLNATLGQVRVQGVNASFNVGHGLVVNPPHWIVNAGTTGGSYLLVAGNTFIANNEGAGSTQFEGAVIFTTGGSDVISGTITGNNVRTAGAVSGFFRLMQFAGAALTSPSALGIGVRVRDAETGWGTTPQLTFTNGEPMLHNEALLRTP